MFLDDVERKDQLKFALEQYDFKEVRSIAQAYIDLQNDSTDEIPQEIIRAIDSSGVVELLKICKV